jgi:RNA polymerase sigma factor (sigma-70 family)
LLGIARHKVDDYYRRRIHEAIWPEENDTPDAELAQGPVYDQQFDRGLDRERVQRVLASMPEEYCLILLWRYREGHSTREMAEMMTKTEKAVERLLARARAQFRRRWDHVQP